jgi:hypothetical protein
MAHYNSPGRFSAPWEDAGLHQTRTAGKRRLWLYSPEHDGGSRWTCAVAGEGSSGGASREEALENAKNW